VARAKYRSKIDLSDAYEQVRIRPEDVPKTAFATIYGTFVSHTMQIGDCNAPATFQRLMTTIFRPFIGRSMHVYLDDLFIFSNSIEEHETHLREVFETLRKNKLYLKWKKCELYAESVDCLGHIIDDHGIHAVKDKIDRIRSWRTPRNYNDVQKFVGLVNYLSHFLPDVSMYTAPLLAITQNGTPFHWHAVHQRCFDIIKDICAATPVLQPIRPKENKEPIWLICDASKTGVGAVYGQGPNWQECRPAGFLSKKFTSAQQNYAVFELETLAILEALMKWEDKLFGYRIHIITDHKALEFFKSQEKLSPRQIRWHEYMSRFDFDITYVKGESNKIADVLSRYYESDTTLDIHAAYEYVRADQRIDPTGSTLPKQRWKEMAEAQVELRAMEEVARRRSRRLQERREARDVEADAMAAANAAQVSTTKPSVGAARPSQVEDEDVSLGDTLLGGEFVEDPLTLGDEPSFLESIRSGYNQDTFFSRLEKNPTEYKGFTKGEDGLWRTKNHRDDNVICVPNVPYEEHSTVGMLIEQAHRIVGHYGSQRTAEYLRRWYWWPQMNANVRSFCLSCEACARAKDSNQKPMGKLHSLPVPVKPWDSIGMDFVGPFPEVDGYNYLWVVICRMTSMVHLIPVNTKMKASQLSTVYMREVVRLHGLPTSIVSDRDSKFTSKWWRELHRLLGARLLMSTSFHPQTDAQTERANRNIGQIFRSIVAPDQKDWLSKLDLVEFAINSSISATTGYAPFELVNGCMPSMIRELRSDGVIPPGIKAFAERALLNMAEAHDAIIERRVVQASKANERRRDEPTLKKGDLVYLSTKNLNLPKGRARKLCPRFIGPYRIEQARPESSTYTLELPLALQSRRIHPTFHVSLLRPHYPSDDSLFPNRLQPEPYDFGAPDDHEWFVDDIIGHRWDTERDLSFLVKWSLGEPTWEPLDGVKELEALDRYLELHGVKRVRSLPKNRATK
jgi:hypothetical protein